MASGRRGVTTVTAEAARGRAGGVEVRRRHGGAAPSRLRHGGGRARSRPGSGHEGRTLEVKGAEAAALRRGYGAQGCGGTFGRRAVRWALRRAVWRRGSESCVWRKRTTLVADLRSPAAVRRAWRASTWLMQDIVRIRGGS